VNFEKGRHLYGRYWGCLADYEMLHFELCYYQLIERAIARRCTLFEAGAQGEHKLKRGLAPAFTHSAHLIRHPGLRAAIADYVAREAQAVEQELASTRYTRRSVSKRDLAVGDVDADVTAVRELAEEQLVGERALDLVLQHARERRAPFIGS
jgi:hypothetical protein